MIEVNTAVAVFTFVIIIVGLIACNVTLAHDAAAKTETHWAVSIFVVVCVLAATAIAYNIGRDDGSKYDCASTLWNAD